MPLFAGVMSGTSLDGVDAAIAEIVFRPGDTVRPRAKVKQLAMAYVPFPEDVRSRLRGLRAGIPTPICDTCELQILLAQAYTDSVRHALRRSKMKASDLTAVGVHGQTVWHAPPSSGAAFPATLQLNAPAVMAELLGTTIVSDFRTRDIAAGGEGAPLVPFADYILLADENETRCMVNIGGIANLTYLPAGGSLDDLIAFDTGPGNLLIDGAVRHAFSRPFDDGGLTAASGAVDAALLAELLADPFYARRPPKSTGAELFGDAYLSAIRERRPMLAPEDLIATLTRLTALSIASAIHDHLPLAPHRVIAGGGGTHNATLMADLAERLPCPLVTHADFGIADDFKEALAFAILAAATMADIPANVPSATGAKGYRVLGSVTRP
jgi:anhydro-N-acetylmuramic acid kinase